MRPRVVLCGSYHRAPDQLRRLFRELEVTGCRILSPISIDFPDTTVAVVAATTESDLTIAELETFHLRAIRDADFVLVHTPGGHIGTSASYELGYASALQKPAFAFETPADEMLATRIQVVGSVFEALDRLQLIS